MMTTPYEIRPIGYVEPPVVEREIAPKQGFEGAPDDLTWSGTSSNLTMIARSYRV